MIKRLSESEMEKILESKRYSIRIGQEQMIDSTLVSEYAVQLGYKIKMDKATGINQFSLN